MLVIINAFLDAEGFEYLRHVIDLHEFLECSGCNNVRVIHTAHAHEAEEFAGLFVTVIGAILARRKAGRDNYGSAAKICGMRSSGPEIIEFLVGELIQAVSSSDGLHQAPKRGSYLFGFCCSSSF